MKNDDMKTTFHFLDVAAQRAHHDEFMANAQARVAIEVARRTAARSTGFWARLWFVLFG